MQLALGLAEADETPGGVHGQRAQENGVHDREHRGVGADAQPQSQQRRGGEAGCPREPAQRVAEILDHSDLSAVMGSTREARRAGIAHAAAETARRNAAAARNDTGSAGETS